MATTATSEASEIRRRGRRRLIGAIAIAVLLVVFVPMILDSETRTPRSGPSTDIPNKDKAAPLPPASAPLIPHKPLPAEQKPVAPAPVTPAKAGAQSVTPVETGAQPKAAPPPTPVKPAPSPPSPKLEGFAVQVGAFKDEEKLKDARERLAAAGVPHYTERRDTAGGGLTRLRAGPFPTREAADAALAKIKLNALDGQVVPLP
ncbi:MAG TPA: SPOR domain-containing protein [Usitatibacter sp.]|nr:SPOR domain-containing protein [Usitatibacter sp.]